MANARREQLVREVLRSERAIAARQKAERNVRARRASRGVYVNDDGWISNPSAKH